MSNRRPQISISNLLNKLLALETGSFTISCFGRNNINYGLMHVAYNEWFYLAHLGETFCVGISRVAI